MSSPRYIVNSPKIAKPVSPSSVPALGSISTQSTTTSPSTSTLSQTSSSQMSPVSPSSLQSSFYLPSSSINNTSSPVVHMDEYSSQDDWRATIASPFTLPTNRDSFVEYDHFTERGSNGMDEFGMNSQANVRRDTLLSPSQTTYLPENPSHETSSSPPRQYQTHHRDHTALFRETLFDDANRLSSPYPECYPDSDNSDDGIITSYSRSHNNSNENQISDDDEENSVSITPPERTVIEHVGDVLFSAVTLFECIPYVSVLKENYSTLDTEITQALGDLEEYVSWIIRS